MKPKTWIEETWPDGERQCFQRWTNDQFATTRHEIVKEVLSKFRDEVQKRSNSKKYQPFGSPSEAMREIFRELEL